MGDEQGDLAMHDAAASGSSKLPASSCEKAASPPQQPTTKPHHHRPNAGATLHQSTLRPTWLYLHLRLIYSPALPPPPASTPPPGASGPAAPAAAAAPAASAVASADLDPVVARTLLAAPLAQYLGHAGAAIALDVLKIAGRDVWVRVPDEDGGAVVSALSSWAGVVPGGGGKKKQKKSGGGGGAGAGAAGTESAQDDGERVRRRAWRIVERASWLNKLVGQGEADGRDLFDEP
ncbi:hypothetical protein BDY21DRAFT_376147 [Lineolata rhizophorae]|uniref:Ribonucleases P/MRP subunit Pop8-like domain-containing protein n=1 Tax=Lineolata rhizophorae TaxID=578093 RepID=A0A6A6PEF0_9PEZI|nr:hypothetical protein BDY21DRAFT_376147 [Lineolata rhizophorae]